MTKTTETSKEIKAVLILKDLTETKMAERIGTTQGAISHTVLGRRSGIKIRNAISSILNIGTNVWQRLDEELALLRGNDDK